MSGGNILTQLASNISNISDVSKTVEVIVIMIMLLVIVTLILTALMFIKIHNNSKYIAKKDVTKKETKNNHPYYARSQHGRRIVLDTKK